MTSAKNRRVLECGRSAPPVTSAPRTKTSQCSGVVEVLRPATTISVLLHSKAAFLPIPVQCNSVECCAPDCYRDFQVIAIGTFKGPYSLRDFSLLLGLQIKTFRRCHDSQVASGFAFRHDPVAEERHSKKSRMSVMFLCDAGM